MLTTALAQTNAARWPISSTPAGTGGPGTAPATITLGGISTKPLGFVGIRFHAPAIATGCNDVIGMASTIEGV